MPDDSPHDHLIKAVFSRLERWLPDFEFTVIDLPQQDLREIRGHIIGRVTLALMQAASQDRVPEFFEEYGSFFEELLSQTEVMGIVRTLFVYAMKTTEDKERLVRSFQALPNPDLKERAMSVAEQLIAEGLEKGRIQTILLLLQDRFGEDASNLEEAVRSLSGEQLRELTLAILHFGSIEDAANWLRARRP